MPKRWACIEEACGTRQKLASVKGGASHYIHLVHVHTIALFGLGKGAAILAMHQKCEDMGKACLLWFV